MDALVDAWLDAITSFEETVMQISDSDFAAPSLLPGWTVGDVVAHVAALEAELAERELPDHEPDWEDLTHAVDSFSRYTERGVDARRAWPPALVRGELREVVEERTEQLRSVRPGDVITGIRGRTMPVEQLLRMRCFDIVVHEVDVRDALGLPGPHLGAGARVCLDQMASGLGYVFAKRAAARPGQVLHMVVPDWVDVWITMGEDGRARISDPGEATVTVTLPVEQFLRLAAGRRGDTGSAEVAGDPALARQVLAGLNVAP